MKIIFNKLKLNNFMSFQSAELDLDKVGYFIIKGINNNKQDSALSNGSGKSTLFEALCWVLTGETVRGTKEVSNIYTGESAIVELDFLVDFHRYKLIRKKKPSSLTLFVDDKDVSGKGIRDTEKILAQYLPDLSSSLIGSVILLGQGLPQRFTNNSPSGRKEVLEKLSKSNFMVEELKVNVSIRKKELNDNLRGVEDKLLVLSTDRKNKLNEKEKVLNELESLPDVKDLEDGIKALYFNKRILEDGLNGLDSEIQQYISSRKSEEELKEQLQQNLLTCTSDIQDKYNPDINYYKDSIEKLEKEIFGLSQQIVKLDSIVDVCPTCGQKLEGVEKPDSEPLKIEKNDLLKDKKVLEDVLAKLETDLSSELETCTKDLKTKIKKSVDVISYSTSQAADAEKNREILNTELNEVKNKIAVKEYAIQTYQETQDKYNNSLKEIEEVIEKFDDDILYNTKEKEQLEQRIGIVNKIFSALNKDFRGYLLINVIKYIDKISKKYCNEVFGNNNIEFKLDGNNISITYSGKEYENLSGGEKQKIDIIIQFAIRDMLSKYLNFSSNILVLDEVTDFLDVKGINSILKLISTNLNNTPAIYFITHHENLMFPYDGEITVVKDSTGISELVMTG